MEPTKGVPDFLTEPAAPADQPRDWRVHRRSAPRPREPAAELGRSTEKCTCALHLLTKKFWHPWKIESMSPARSSHEACDSHCTDLLWSRVRFSESKQVRGCPGCQTFEGDTVR